MSECQELRSKSPIVGRMTLVANPADDQGHGQRTYALGIGIRVIALPQPGRSLVAGDHVSAHC
jgi:hypothetical protein